MAEVKVRKTRHIISGSEVMGSEQPEVECSISYRVLTVEAVIFNGRGDLLVIEQEGGKEWALPGTVVMDHETVEQAIIRGVQESTGGLWPEDFELRLFRLFSEPGRCPDGPSIAAAFLGVAADTVHLRVPGAFWAWVGDWRKRAFILDHKEIAQRAWDATGLKVGPLKSLQGEIAVAKEVKLTLKQEQYLRRLYEGTINKPLHNPTMQALQRQGMAEPQSRTEGDEVICHWTITEKGRAKISS